MFRVLGPRVLVKRDDTPGEQKKGSLIIPMTAQEKPFTATVIDVGSAPEQHPDYRTLCDLKAGMKVVIGKYSGTDVIIDGQSFTVLPAAEVLGYAQ